MRRMHGIVGVTGTPGTGKKSIAPILAAALGAKCLSINELASAHGLLVKRGQEWEVDVEKLRQALGALSGPAVVYGHLLPQALEPRLVTHAVVLRCEPAVLKERLLGRGYPPRKLIDNVESELIGVVSSEAFEAFGETKTFEFDCTTSAPREGAAALAKLIEGESEPGPRIDWTLAYDTGAKLRSLLSTGRS